VLPFLVIARAIASLSHPGANVSALTWKLKPASSLSRHSPPATRHLPISPLFVALPYISSVSPLSSAFTHLNGECGVDPLCCSDDLFKFRYLLSRLFSSTCCLLALSLQRFHSSFRLFSATCRHFFADQGGGALLLQSRKGRNHPDFRSAKAMASCTARSMRRARASGVR
jgi:hypothetical protein